MILGWRFFKSKKGFSLVEVMMASGLISLAGLAMMGLSQLANQDSLQLRATRIVLSARSQVEAALQNPASWQQTVAQNPSLLACATGSGCSLASTSTGYYDFVLYGTGASEKITFDPNDLTTRYSIQGGPCAPGIASQDSQCPIKYVARWKPLCQIYPCKNPTLDIKVSLVLEFGMKAPPLNPQKYEYDSVRGIGDGSLQSACQILNGIYNAINRTCLPKYKGKACPAEQIVTSVAADGNISCAPLYNGKCNPQTQVMTGINTSGVAQCGLKAQSANCPTACVGGWGACTKTCGSGKQTYVVITPATNGGAACIAPAPGTEQDCNTGACSEDCVGSWGACTQACGGGIKTYTVTQPKSGTGAACQNSHGDSIPCNTQACGPNTDCGGNWSSCNPVTGTKTFTITQAPQGSGAACPLPLTEKCSVDCVGSWGACSGGPPAYRTYNWTTPPLNGGSAATCQYPNGRTDAAACAGSIDCSGTWNSCDQITGTRTFNIIQLPQGVGAAACPSPLTQSCPVPCKGSWGNCAGGPPQYKTYTWTQLPLNGGSAAACEAGNGATDFAACAVPVPCLGDWSSCDKASGTTTFVVSQAPLNGGSVCPNPLTKSCPVACEGGWGVCAGGPPQVKTYTWTVQPLNGGAKCSVKDGEQDTTACVTGPPPAPVQSASYVSRFLGCDWGTDTWFVYTSATTGVLYFQKNDSCHNTFYKQTPYIYNGSAWVPSGPSTYTGGDLRGYCMKAC